VLIFTAQIAFADSDLNVCTMMCELYKLVIQKTDQTAIDLGDKSAAYTVKANKMAKTGEKQNFTL